MPALYSPHQIRRGLLCRRLCSMDGCGGLLSLAEIETSMRKYFLWPPVIIAGLLIVLAMITVVNRYELDLRSPAVSVRLTQPAPRTVVGRPRVSPSLSHQPSQPCLASPARSARSTAPISPEAPKDQRGRRGATGHVRSMAVDYLEATASLSCHVVPAAT